MSYTEFHFGKLKKVDFQDESTLEEKCQLICKKLNIEEISSYNDSWEEELRTEGDKKYYVIGEDIYEMIEHEGGEDEGYFEKLIPNADGTFTILAQFYNGGTCLSEVVEDALTKYLEENK